MTTEFYTNYEGSEKVHVSDICPVCYGSGGAIGAGDTQPCHSGPFYAYEVSEATPTLTAQQPTLKPSEFAPTKWGCPKCGFPVERSEYDGDDGAMCACGCWVPLPSHQPDELSEVKE